MKITKIIHQLEPLGKINHEFQRVCLKSRQNGQKCLKTATKVGKIGQKSHKMTKNQIERPKICCNWNLLVSATQMSIPNTCYLPKNGPEKTKKGQKRPKVAKKWILFVKIRPLDNVF